MTGTKIFKIGGKIIWKNGPEIDKPPLKMGLEFFEWDLTHFSINFERFGAYHEAGSQVLYDIFVLITYFLLNTLYFSF